MSGIIRDYGSITRNGEDTEVLVCINNDSADFYLDDETQTLYDYVDYPITLQGDPWEEFQSIDFADRDGDGNGDVAMLFELDGQQVLMVWFWDADTETKRSRPLSMAVRVSPCWSYSTQSPTAPMMITLSSVSSPSRYQVPSKPR